MYVFLCLLWRLLVYYGTEVVYELSIVHCYGLIVLTSCSGLIVCCYMWHVFWKWCRLMYLTCLWKWKRKRVCESDEESLAMISLLLFDNCNHVDASKVGFRLRWIVLWRRCEIWFQWRNSTIAQPLRGPWVYHNTVWLWKTFLFLYFEWRWWKFIH